MLFLVAFKYQNGSNMSTQYVRVNSFWFILYFLTCEITWLSKCFMCVWVKVGFQKVHMCFNTLTMYKNSDWIPLRTAHSAFEGLDSASGLVVSQFPRVVTWAQAWRRRQMNRAATRRWRDMCANVSGSNNPKITKRRRKGCPGGIHPKLQLKSSLKDPKL